ncbi:MAG TPA: SGNH/GDSL hydrolase family protein [Tepidisphaeraceae bacterium]|jgi:lysophospholipase L1-like esterase|nr:SGNH/GDSL hydrolase family protein [Tepidisphaeraceae bacterium]
MKPLAPLLLLVVSLAAVSLRAGEPPNFVFKDGDRVAFVGATFVEREATTGYIETLFTARSPAANLTFRNLGYSGDTVTGEARGLCTGWSTFESPDKAFERLRKLVAEYKPTVLVVNYGMTESFAGPGKIAEFSADYAKTLDQLTSAAGGQPRVVLVSPNYHEDLGRPLPDPSEHNKNLKLYAAAISDLATKRGYTYIDLFALTEAAAPSGPLTSNGIHLTPYGYWRTALAMEQAMGAQPGQWRVDIKAGTAGPTAVGTRLLHPEVSASRVTFGATDVWSTIPPAPAGSPKQVINGTAAIPGTQRILNVAGLKPGAYELKAGGEVLAKASAEEWAKGVSIQSPASEIERVEKLRKLIVAKNFDYFNYQRPENDSYILAFRKGEQGRNAIEIPRFLPLVEQKEQEIAKLRVPQSVSYTLEPAK